MNTVLSYHNDPAIKAQHVALARHHYEADMLRSGTYGQGTGDAFRGCSVGCMAHDLSFGSSKNLHAVVATDAGWPEWLVHLNDSMFEGLPLGERELFHVQLREAVPVGVDLEPIKHRLAARRMGRLITLQESQIGKHGENIDGVLRQTIEALSGMRRVQEALSNSSVCEISLESAARSAWSAESAAEAAAAARSAVAAAWSAEAAEAAEAAAWIEERDTLFSLLKEMEP